MLFPEEAPPGNEYTFIKQTKGFIKCTILVKIMISVIRVDYHSKYTIQYSELFGYVSFIDLEHNKCLFLVGWSSKPSNK